MFLIPIGMKSLQAATVSLHKAVCVSVSDWPPAGFQLESKAAHAFYF